MKLGDEALELADFLAPLGRLVATGSRDNDRRFPWHDRCASGRVRAAKMVLTRDPMVMGYFSPTDIPALRLLFITGIFANSLSECRRCSFGEENCMSFDEDLADRVRLALGTRRGLTEKRMFGGLAFLLRGNMCCGVMNRELIVRVSRDQTDEMLAEPHTRAFDFTGRAMSGFVVVRPAGCEDEETLAEWVTRAVAFASGLPAK